MLEILCLNCIGASVRRNVLDIAGVVVKAHLGSLGSHAWLLYSCRKGPSWLSHPRRIEKLDRGRLGRACRRRQNVLCRVHN